MKIVSANRKVSDVTPRLAASHLGLFCLPMSNKKDAMLVWANQVKDSLAFWCQVLTTSLIPAAV